jgi:hypothetical protein
MNVFNSLDNSSGFLISNIDYEMITLIKSSMSHKLNSIKGRIIMLQNSIKHSHDKDIIRDYQRQINYFQNLIIKIKESIDKIDNALS